MFLATYAGMSIQKKNLSEIHSYVQMHVIGICLRNNMSTISVQAYGRPDLRRCQPTLEACSTKVFTSWLKLGLGLGFFSVSKIWS